MIRIKSYIQSISVGVNNLFKSLKPVGYICMNFGSFLLEHGVGTLEYW